MSQSLLSRRLFLCVCVIFSYALLTAVNFCVCSLWMPGSDGSGFPAALHIFLLYVTYYLSNQFMVNEILHHLLLISVEEKPHVLEICTYWKVVCHSLTPKRKDRYPGPTHVKDFRNRRKFRNANRKADWTEREARYGSQDRVGGGALSTLKGIQVFGSGSIARAPTPVL